MKEIENKLSSMLPGCAVIVENNDIAVERGNKTIYVKVNFGELFELIMNDRMERGQDSEDIYLSTLCKAIVGELDKVD